MTTYKQIRATKNHINKIIDFLYLLYFRQGLQPRKQKHDIYFFNVSSSTFFFVENTLERVFESK